jgi:hypothetical protein
MRAPVKTNDFSVFINKKFLDQLNNHFLPKKDPALMWVNHSAVLHV